MKNEFRPFPSLGAPLGQIWLPVWMKPDNKDVIQLKFQKVIAHRDNSGKRRIKKVVWPCIKHISFIRASHFDHLTNTLGIPVNPFKINNHLVTVTTEQLMSIPNPTLQQTQTFPLPDTRVTIPSLFPGVWPLVLGKTDHHSIVDISGTRLMVAPYLLCWSLPKRKPHRKPTEEPQHRNPRASC